MKVLLSPRWTIGGKPRTSEPVDATRLIQVLSQIETAGSIAAAGRALGLSYRHVWGILRDAEELFGATLIVKQPGKGTQLSELANVLIQADKRFSARLAPTLESLASELEAELRKALPSQQDVVRLFASHGFAVETLLAVIKKRDVLAEIRYRTSNEALAALQGGECHLAGFHVPEGEFQDTMLQQYLKWLTPECLLIKVATRRQGLFTERGNPLGISNLSDLSRKSIRFVNRQSGSGTRTLVELMLRKHRLWPQDINGFETAEFTHAAVAAYIASGMADVGFGVETAAKKFDLNFIPLATERYFFAVKETDLKLAGVAQIVASLKSADFLSVATGLDGYNVIDAGNIISVQDAFRNAS